MTILKSKFYAVIFRTKIRKVKFWKLFLRNTDTDLCSVFTVLFIFWHSDIWKPVRSTDTISYTRYSMIWSRSASILSSPICYGSLTCSWLLFILFSLIKTNMNITSWHLTLWRVWPFFWSYLMFILTPSTFVLLSFQGTTYLPLLWNGCTKRILLPISFQVFMYLIPLLFICPWLTVKHWGTGRVSVSRPWRWLPWSSCPLCCWNSILLLMYVWAQHLLCSVIWYFIRRDFTQFHVQEFLMPVKPAIIIMKIKKSAQELFFTPVQIFFCSESVDNYDLSLHCLSVTE